MSRLRVHIGHNFFGAGNIGDDLMLAGFLAAARPAFLDSATFTCCIPHGADSQQLRFPEITWLPYDDATRASAIAECDVWAGIGDTPFQSAVGSWFTEHLVEEAALCVSHAKPMFYLGVGVETPEVVNDPRVGALIQQAEKIWTRDGDSAAALRPLATAGKVTVGADLAHLGLAEISFPKPATDELGLLLNFEDARQYESGNLVELVEHAPADVVAWLTQEVRALEGSEELLYGELTPSARDRIVRRIPNYDHARSADGLLSAWGVPATLVSSRYHGALIGAWMGCRVVVVARSAKVAGAARQLGLLQVKDLHHPAEILRLVVEAAPVSRTLLTALSELARASCDAFFDLASRSSRRSPGEIMAG